jgi:hypothetical protein
MDKPVLSRPKVEDWKTTDEEISQFLDGLSKNDLNIESWSFPVETSKGVEKQTYAQIMGKSSEEGMYCSLQTMKVFRYTFSHLPVKLQNIRDKVFTSFEKIIFNVEERLNFIEAQSSYIDQLEEQLLEQNKLLAELGAQKTILETRQESLSLQAKLEVTQKLYDRLVNNLPAEKVGKAEICDDKGCSEVEVEKINSPKPKPAPQRKY